MRRLPLATCLLALTLLTACPGEEDPEANNNTMMTSNNATTSMMTTVEPPDEYAEQYQMRFTALRFADSVQGSAVLNLLLRKNFDQRLEYPIVVLFELNNLDEQAGTAKLRGGAGLKTMIEGEYNWDPPQGPDSFDATFDAETGAFTGTIPLLNFKATLDNNGMVQTFDLPLRDLAFTGTLGEDDDGALVEDGTLEGYVTIEDARNVMVDSGGMIVTAASLLNEEAADLDTDGDEEPDAWNLSATFKATQTTILP